jgi:hypothetical protein
MPQNCASGFTEVPHDAQYFTPGFDSGGAAFGVVTVVATEVDSLGAIAPPINTRRPGRKPERRRAKTPVMINPTLCWLGLPRHINHTIEKISAKTVITAKRTTYPVIILINTAIGGNSGGSAEGGIDGRNVRTIATNPVPIASRKKKMSCSTAPIITSVEDVPSSAILNKLR